MDFPPYRPCRKLQRSISNIQDVVYMTGIARLSKKKKASLFQVILWAAKFLPRNPSPLNAARHRVLPSEETPQSYCLPMT